MVLTNPRELAAVIASLRLLQAAHGIPAQVLGIATNEGEHTALSEAEIDDLIERINVAPEPVTEPPVKMCCAVCGSEEVLRDAYAQWDVAQQQWILHSVYDNAVCEKCDGDADLKEVPIEAEPGTSTDPQVPTMFCIRCEHDAGLAWSNAFGWVDNHSYDLFTAEERATLTLPLQGRWVPI